ncbi:MAG: SUMF1/EgtB/PvdO family nonheme iron enzyme [Candidatus Lokiarchaeota archaeon]|nr:SUMF1/EgtB/PvdO family nonheme iron enzyme [Candidatus Lokiarchaeota archaeon]
MIIEKNGKNRKGSIEMRNELYNLKDWDALSREEKGKIVVDMVKNNEIPLKIKDLRLLSFRAGSQEHDIPILNSSEGFFALIPGIQNIELGQDRNILQSTDDMIEEYKQSAEEYELPDYQKFLELSLKKPYKTKIKPFIIECVAREAGLKKISDEKTERGGMMTFKNGKTIRKDTTGTYEINTRTFAQIAKYLEETPFSLPTEEQWEYACRGGVKTLFKWGNTCPTDGYPIDRTTFNLHLQPNAFGLDITRNPYNWELTETGSFVGGDGGSAICGGTGFFLGWFQLACSLKPSNPFREDSQLFGAHVRRIINLTD